MQRLKPLSTTSLPHAPESLTVPPSVERLPKLPLQTISGSPTPAQLSKAVPLPEWGLRKILGFDLENRPWSYWYDGMPSAQITAFGWKWTDEAEAHSLCLTGDGSFVDDEGVRWPYKTAHTMFADILTSADLVFGHNIRRHDLPLIKAHRLRLSLPMLPEVLTTDTLKDFPKNKLGMSASLSNLLSYFGFEGEKKTMNVASWENSNSLYESGIEDTRERVVGDVLLQEQLLWKLRELEYLTAPRVWK